MSPTARDPHETPCLHRKHARSSFVPSVKAFHDPASRFFTCTSAAWWHRHRAVCGDCFKTEGYLKALELGQLVEISRDEWIVATVLEDDPLP